MVLKTFDTATVPNQVFALPLTPEAFAPYGGVISADEQIKKAKSSSANYGTAIKLHDVVPVTNEYAKCPSGKPATAHMNVFRSSAPRTLISRRGQFNAYRSTVLERHPFSSQAFIPIGQDARKPSYLVIVAKTDESTVQKLPDPKTLKAFICRGNQSITYAPGTWHAPMVVIDETVPHIDFAVLIHENGVTDEDCEECYFKPGYSIKYTNQIASNSARL